MSGKYLKLFRASDNPFIRGRIGKSTYLRQVGLLTVMAMCGCFVPAEYASFRIHDALLTRLSNDDDMEKSLSTFATEMASSAMILGMIVLFETFRVVDAYFRVGLASPNSLVLIDELGRGTSPREGVGISHAIAEGLIEIKVCFFFAFIRNSIEAHLCAQVFCFLRYVSAMELEYVCYVNLVLAGTSTNSARPYLVNQPLSSVLSFYITDGLFTGYFSLHLSVHVSCKHHEMISRVLTISLPATATIRVEPWNYFPIQVHTCFSDGSFHA